MAHFIRTQIIVATFHIVIISGAVISDPEILTRPNSDIIVTMSDSVIPIITSFTDNSFSSDKISSLASDLQLFTSLSQAPVRAMLSSFGNVEFQPFWITNKIFVKNASPPMVQSLMGLNIVKKVARDLIFPILPIFGSKEGNPPDGPTWSVKKIGADLLWSETQGEGILVATIDTGVRGTHAALKNNYIGSKNYGWFDPLLHLADPYDLNGHGTHTTATIAGDNGVGVAPKAKWMTCKGCDAFNCFESALIACGQFVLCPHDHTGQNRNCSKAPHIVSNSWGGGMTEEFFNPIIAAWKAAGIISFFAAGNNGPECSTLTHPGNQEDTITIGSTDADDNLSPFSSRGPNTGKGAHILKPDILAPGGHINSAYYLNDNSYRLQSGTSMACPHVSGAAALLLSKNRNLRVEHFMELFYKTTDDNITRLKGESCGPIPENTYPNHMYGHGRINVYKAYRKMVTDKKYGNITAFQPKVSSMTLVKDIKSPGIISSLLPGVPIVGIF